MKGRGVGPLHLKSKFLFVYDSSKKKKKRQLIIQTQNNPANSSTNLDGFLLLKILEVRKYALIWITAVLQSNDTNKKNQ